MLDPFVLRYPQNQNCCFYGQQTAYREQDTNLDGEDWTQGKVYSQGLYLIKKKKKKSLTLNRPILYMMLFELISVLDKNIFYLIVDYIQIVEKLDLINFFMSLDYFPFK